MHVCLCVGDIIHVLCVCVCVQGVNRVVKDAQVGHGGERRKDWHDYEAIKRDASRSGGSKPPHGRSSWTLCDM